MPTKRLPKTLVERLEKTMSGRGIKNFYGAMKKMENVDYRRDLLTLSDGPSLHWPGEKVRAMNVSKNYPKIGKVVLKRSHYKDDLAERGLEPDTLNEIERVIKTVRRHNRQPYADRRAYVMLEPKAYEVGGGIIAMHKTDKPVVAEIICKDGKFQTKRGNQYLERLRKRHGFKLVNRRRLRTAVDLAERHTREILKHSSLDEHTLLLLGVNKKGQFVFMPLIDIF